MKNRTLPLSLLIGAALTIPSLAMAAPAKPKPKSAPAKTAIADQTPQADVLESDVENSERKPASIQSNAVEISETKTFSRSRASTNDQNATQSVGIETGNIQNPQDEPQEDMVDPQEGMPELQGDMQAPQEEL